MELWSLMHFLMPNVFQSHREFKEWFSNPVTGMIEGNSEYNENIIRRLHKVCTQFFNFYHLFFVFFFFNLNYKYIIKRNYISYNVVQHMYRNVPYIYIYIYLIFYTVNLISNKHSPQVLRPFLLRRLKTEVEKQLPKKYEHVVMCRLSKRQRFLYDDFMSRAK